jgi:hypothetical protein
VQPSIAHALGRPRQHNSAAVAADRSEPRQKRRCDLRVIVAVPEREHHFGRVAGVRWTSADDGRRDQQGEKSETGERGGLLLVAQ